MTVCLDKVVYLTNRFQVAVRLFSNRSQMKSKCGKNNRLESLFYLIKGYVTQGTVDVICSSE